LGNHAAFSPASRFIGRIPVVK
jgi:hypothetical protein